MMNPADISIRPVDGGFFIEWLELQSPEARKNAPPMGFIPGMGSLQKREAVRSNIKDALKFVESILMQKEMLRKAGKLDIPEDGGLMGGTQMFREIPTPPFPPGMNP